MTTITTAGSVPDLMPPIGAKPGWLQAVQRISALAGAIQRYADADEGAAPRRQFLIQMWATELNMQIDIWKQMMVLEGQYLQDGEKKS